MAAAMTPAATYIWVACAVGMTGALRGEYLDIYDVVWSWPLFADGEYFRAPLSLCFIGDTLTIWYGINLYFLYKNSADYEASLGSSALFLWHLLLGAFLVLCGAAVFDVSFPGLALASFVQSLWCSANPNQRVSLHGLVVPAKYLDAVLLVIKLFQGDSWRSQVIGLIAGHVAHSHFVLHPALCEPPFIKAAADLLQSSLQFWGPAAPSLLALGDHVVVKGRVSRQRFSARRHTARRRDGNKLSRGLGARRGTRKPGGSRVPSEWHGGRSAICCPPRTSTARAESSAASSPAGATLWICRSCTGRPCPSSEPTSCGSEYNRP